MFTSGKGLTAEGLYKTDMLTAMAEQKMLSVVGKLVVLVDSSKIGERAGMLFSRADQIDMLIGKNANRKSCNNWKRQHSACLKDAGGKMSRQHQRLRRNAVTHARLP